MGDYTAKGVKLGTCGRAYYATKNQIKELAQDSETKYYLNSENKCMFAFPLPEFDNKKAGEISIFHKEERDLTVLEIKNTNFTFHQKIVFHKHPVGGSGINLFCDCPYHSKENVSRNFNDDTLKFYLKYQSYTGKGEEMAIVAECIYCGESNVFEKSEAEEACEVLIKNAVWNETEAKRPEYKNCTNSETHLKKAEELREIAKRILETY